MAERTTEREDEECEAVDESVVDLNVGEETADADALSTRVGERATSVFAPRAFLLLLGAAAAGVFAVGNLIPLLPLAGFVGLLLTMGVAGLASPTRRYVEAGAAGAVAGAVGLFAGSVTLTVLTGGLPLAVGGVVGALAALLGYYAGRDLRDGLTREL